jgi:hypothetical protein
MSKKITLPSGRILEIQSDFGPAKELFKVVARELLAVNIDIDKIDLQKLNDVTTGELNILKNAVLALAGSDAVERCVQECMRTCLYKGDKIGPQTWEDEQARKDWLPVTARVLWENLSPFFGGLDLKSLMQKLPIANDRGSASTSQPRTSSPTG